ncbi:hypothetical protein [Azospirillum cavernae]|nr:hypothetical protein [Azospirillum cavernae]
MPGARQATNVMFGYLEGVERKDAESYARAFGRRCLKSSESCWYAVEPLWSGYLYEIHEGGPGYSFLPALAKEIDANPGGVALVPSGRRVFELTVRNGRPVGALLSETRSREVQSRMAVVQPADRVGDRPFGLIVPAWAPQGHVRFHAILTSRRMKRLSPAIPLQLAAAAVGFLAGAALLLGGGVTYYWSPHRVPTARNFDINRLPHRQWDTVLSAITASSYAAKLEFKDGKWTIETQAPPEPKR